jgi:hypothetical protein
VKKEIVATGKTWFVSSMSRWFLSNVVCHVFIENTLWDVIGKISDNRQSFD